MFGWSFGLVSILSRFCVDIVWWQCGEKEENEKWKEEGREENERYAKGDFSAQNYICASTDDIFFAKKFANLKNLL